MSNGILKIKITIAGRVYPLNIQSEQEEEGLRKAADKINSLVRRFEENYAVSDKQDVLAMCALQFASSLELNAIENRDDSKAVALKLKLLNKMIEDHL